MANSSKHEVAKKAAEVLVEVLKTLEPHEREEILKIIVESYCVHCGTKLAPEDPDYCDYCNGF